MEAIAKHVKHKLAPEREKVIDDILDEYPSCNSDQVEQEADQRMLERYIDAFIKEFQSYIVFFYHLKLSDIYKEIIETKDEAMVEYEEEYDMTNEKELELLLQTIADKRELYEDLFI